MRARSIGRWASSALVLALSLPFLLTTGELHAEDKSGPTEVRVSKCVKFKQLSQKHQAGLDFTFKNTCATPLSCSVRWKLACEDEDGATRDSHHADAFDLQGKSSDLVEASAHACGDDTWQITGVRWSCSTIDD